MLVDRIHCIVLDFTTPTLFIPTCRPKYVMRDRLKGPVGPRHSVVEARRSRSIVGPGGLPKQPKAINKCHWKKS